MKFWRTFKSLRSKQRLDAEMSEEMRLHLEQRSRESIASGMSPEDARYEALRKFGGVEQVKEIAREQRGWLWLEHLGQDLRYGARQIRKRPGFASIVVLILGLGVGANTVVFSALEVLVFRSLPVPASEELVVVSKVRNSEPNGRESDLYLSLELFDSLRTQAKSLAGVLNLNGSGGTRALVVPGATAGEPLRVKTSDVSGSYFSVLSIAPLLGRLIAPQDDEKGSARAVAVISHALWQRRFRAERDVIGKTVLIENVPFEIIGVAPEGFAGVKAGEPIEIWTPLWMIPTVNPRFGQNLTSPNWGGLHIMGRLRPGMTRAAAEAEMDLLFQQTMQTAQPSVAPGDRLRMWGRLELQPGAAGVTGDARRRAGPVLGILLAVVALVQVIACANVASLSLARLAGRQRELAARTAMGADRGRLVRQLLTETMLLVTGGAVLGALLVVWGFLAVRNQGIEVHPNGWVFLFGLVLLALAGAIVAFVPALKSTRIDLATAIKAQSGTLSGSRSPLQQTLVVVQLAVCGCLLAGTGYFVRTLQHLRGADLGFTGDKLLLVSLETPAEYNAKRRTALVQELLQAIKVAPGASQVTYSVTGLLTGGTSQGTIAVSGYLPEKNEDMRMRFAFIGPDFFQTIGLPIMRGRGLGAEDVFSLPRGAAPKAVVNEAMVRRFFGSDDPIGHRFSWGTGNEYEIVGVASNAVYRSLREDNLPICYLPWQSFPSPMVALQIKTAGAPRGLTGSLSEIFRRVNPSVRISSIQTMDDVLAQATREERLTAIGVGAFSVLALLLTSLGLYGMLAYRVAQRTREIGVRIALGGQARDIIGMIVKQGLLLTALGWGLGMIVAMGLMRFVTSRLYGVSGGDPVVLFGSGALLAVVALVACWFPARRAAKVDPIVALRAE